MEESTLSESAVRRLAKRKGYLVRKSRIRRPDSSNCGQYCLYNYRGNVVMGGWFDARLEAIERFLKS